MSKNNTQLTPTALDVLERLSGWTERHRYEDNYKPQMVVAAVDNEGVMWLYGDHGAQIKRLEHMEIEGKIFVRDPQ